MESRRQLRDPEEMRQLFDMGQRIREMRLVKGLTQQEVAERLKRYGVKRSYAAVSRAETGKLISFHELAAIARVLGTTATYLAGLNQNPKSWIPDAVAVEGEDTRVYLQSPLLVTAS